MYEHWKNNSFVSLRISSCPFLLLDASRRNGRVVGCLPHFSPPHAALRHTVKYVNIAISYMSLFQIETRWKVNSTLYSFLIPSEIFSEYIIRFEAKKSVNGMCGEIMR